MWIADERLKKQGWPFLLSLVAAKYVDHAESGVGDPVDTIEHQEHGRGHPEGPGIYIVAQGLLVLREAGLRGTCGLLKLKQSLNIFHEFSILLFSAVVSED